ncbi:hypothetical protein PVT67_00420 [Gallaecimonas kandeliae]|uniref:hypothetical protein n=1 Tax=Gallaecimonas kandeliae TaxID=3029055 RepID=UPI0026475DBA|nr:hypothetical protein [Gallaecimonas kandeliae]WKE65755.1 hypothetical protein PVT67_00420 [Gallaecimonas kandeliae]
MNDIPVLASLSSPPQGFTEVLCYRDRSLYTFFTYRDDFLIVVTGDADSKFRLQTELPISALAWLADVIDVQLGWTPNDGGLPVGTALVAQEFDGETIQVCRLANTRGSGEPGFEIKNRSRYFQTTKRKREQYFEFTDEVMRAVGLVEKFRALARS